MKHSKLCFQEFFYHQNLSRSWEPHTKTLSVVIPTQQTQSKVSSCVLILPDRVKFGQKLIYYYHVDIYSDLFSFQRSPLLSLLSSATSACLADAKVLPSTLASWHIDLNWSLEVGTNLHVYRGKWIYRRTAACQQAKTVGVFDHGATTAPCWETRQFWLWGPAVGTESEQRLERLQQSKVFRKSSKYEGVEEEEPSQRQTAGSSRCRCNREINPPTSTSWNSSVLPHCACCSNQPCPLLQPQLSLHTLSTRRAAQGLWAQTPPLQTRNKTFISFYCSSFGEKEGLNDLSPIFAAI